MNSSRLSLLVAMAVVCGAASVALSQPVTPHIGYAYPAGGRQGTTFDVTIGGQSLDGAANVRITGKGVDVTVVEHIKPIKGGQAGQLRDRLAELRKKPSDSETQKEMAEIRKKLAAFLNLSQSKAIVEIVTLRVTVDKDAPLGEREIRLACANGLSNPLTFEVGQLQEFSRDPASKVTDDLIGLRFRQPGEPKPGPAAPPTDVVLPAVVNGQIMPSAVDRFRFQAQKGQHLVIAVAARRLIPYIADAVPGWFQAAITLYDPNGREVGYADHFRFNPDPVLYYEVPGDGQYSLDIRDSIYRGREDFVYRITMGELPYITSVFPLGGHAGKETTVELVGWNLPLKTLIFDARGKAPGVYPLYIPWISNSVPFGVDALPEMQMAKPSAPSTVPQPIAMPVIVNGRIDQLGKWDVFSLQGHAGEEIVAEVTARRLNSTMDSLLKVTDASGRQLAFNDDYVNKVVDTSGKDPKELMFDDAHEDTHHADSYIRVKLPADGIYYVHVGDAQRQSGADCAYRLRISHPMPDFSLRSATATVTIRSGLSTAVMVYALRSDGFAGDIDLKLKDAPPGFSMSAGRVPAGQDWAKITINGPLTPLGDPTSIAIEGKAKIGGQDVIRPAMPAENMMQAFAYLHLVVAKELDVDVVGRLARSMARVISPLPLKVVPGTPSVIQVSTPNTTPFGRLEFQLADPPEGITIKDVSPAAEGSQITLEFDPDKIKPGAKGNLYVAVFVLPKRSATAPAKPNRIPRRISVGVLPAVAYEVFGEKGEKGPTSMPATQTSQATAQK